jgi:hypothetical protein
MFLVLCLDTIHVCEAHFSNSFYTRDQIEELEPVFPCYCPGVIEFIPVFLSHQSLLQMSPELPFTCLSKWIEETLLNFRPYMFSFNRCSEFPKMAVHIYTPAQGSTGVHTFTHIWNFPFSHLHRLGESNDVSVWLDFCFSDGWGGASCWYWPFGYDLL